MERITWNTMNSLEQGVVGYLKQGVTWNMKWVTWNMERITWNRGQIGPDSS